ncbi:MAG: hypothetical protein KDK78_05460, partial [Chlamydiia bacterium]|nr:hypothetical protein [Chlamydiia bacterium]
PFTSAAGA